jgi:hypothetical protein
MFAWGPSKFEIRAGKNCVGPRQTIAFLLLNRDLPMYPTIPTELLSGAVELVICLFTMVAVFITLTITSRG